MTAEAPEQLPAPGARPFATPRLREATLEVLENPRHAHPFYWAPFVLVGNPF